MFDFNKNVTYCTNNSDVCESLSWQIVHGLLDIPCFLMNLFHLIILYRMPSLKKIPSLRAMYIHMALAGMLNGMVTFVRGNCKIMGRIYQQPSLTSSLVSILFDWPGGAKYYIVCFVSYDRYVSICTPMARGSNIILRNANTSLISLWVVLLSMMATFGVLCNESVCIMGNSGPTILFGFKNVFTPVAATLTWLPVMVTTVLACFVIAELRRMIQRTQPGVMNSSDRHIIHTSKYLVIIIVTMVLCLVPVCISISLWCSDKYRHLVEGHLLSLFYLLFMAHGIFDSVVFAIMTPAFRQETRKLIFCICPSRNQLPLPAVKMMPQSSSNESHTNCGSDPCEICIQQQGESME